METGLAPESTELVTDHSAKDYFRAMRDILLKEEPATPPRDPNAERLKKYLSPFNGYTDDQF
jgi:hypothetical protein